MRVLSLIIVGIFLRDCEGDGRKYTSVVLNIEDISEYFELRDTISLTILLYHPATASCGVRASASNCIGITRDLSLGGGWDTLRVLSLCNTDTAYTVGMQIKVAPQGRPNFQVDASMYVTGNSGDIARWRGMRLKTTYGRLLRQR